MCVATVLTLMNELLCDLVLATTAGEKLDHLLLARGQRAEIVAARSDGGGPSVVAPRQRPQACVEPIGVERLHDVVVGADQQARNSIERLDACAGNKHDSHVVAVTLSERATHLVAGDFLEGDLEHDQRRRKSVRKLHRLDARRAWSGTKPRRSRSPATRVRQAASPSAMRAGAPQPGNPPAGTVYGRDDGAQDPVPHRWSGRTYRDRQIEDQADAVFRRGILALRS